MAQVKHKSVLLERQGLILIISQIRFDFIGNSNKIHHLFLKFLMYHEKRSQWISSLSWLMFLLSSSQLNPTQPLEELFMAWWVFQTKMWKGRHPEILVRIRWEVEFLEWNLPHHPRASELWQPQGDEWDIFTTFHAWCLAGPTAQDWFRTV